MTASADPVVSVVIPTRNGAAHLATLLDTLVEQRVNGHFEVILSDNGSTDSTVEVSSRFTSRLDLRVVDASATRGAAFARNVGVSDARASRIVFLDDDDVVAPGYLEAMRAGLDRFEFVAARIDGRTLNPGWRAEMRPSDVKDGLRTGPGFEWALGGALGVARDAFELVGGFDTRLTQSCEDVNFCRRMSEAGFVLHLVPDAVVRRRLRTGRRALFSQARRYEVGRRFEMRLQHRRVGLPRLYDLLNACRLVVLGRTRSQRALGVYLLGRVIGHVEGSVRSRL